jgi:hypothetical protein
LSRSLGDFIQIYYTKVYNTYSESEYPQ